jgi:hypothetical protein
MKLGTILLILGLIIAGAGIYFWQYNNPTFFGYRSDEAQQYFSIGIGGMVVGGVLAIVGIVMMIGKRK